MELDNNVESAVKLEEENKEAAKVEGVNTDSLDTNSTINGLELRKLVGTPVLLDASIQVGMSTKR
ncbi:hypothetical protein IKS57_02915 [bacterium]|nr:hypothetical protein [bacterium]